MSIFNKKSKAKWDKPFSERVANRVSKIPTAELEMWAEQALFDFGRCLTQYGKHRDQVFLNEALVGAEALHAVVNELHTRTTAR